MELFEFWLKGVGDEIGGESLDSFEVWGFGGKERIEWVISGFDS